MKTSRQRESSRRHVSREEPQLSLKDSPLCLGNSLLATYVPMPLLVQEGKIAARKTAKVCGGLVLFRRRLLYSRFSCRLVVFMA